MQVVCVSERERDYDKLGAINCNRIICTHEHLQCRRPPIIIIIKIIVCDLSLSTIYPLPDTNTTARISSLAQIIMPPSNSKTATVAHLVAPIQTQCILILEGLFRSPLGADLLLRFGKIECWREAGHGSRARGRRMR